MSKASVHYLDESEQTPTRKTGAWINLDALADNFHALKKQAKPAKLYAVVKANAYGHGLIPISQFLQSQGAEGFCVALLEEGIELRKAGIESPILVMDGIYGNHHAALFHHRLTPIVHRVDDLEQLQRLAPTEGIGVHLKVDTGLHRLGIPSESLGETLRQLQSMPRIRIEGVMSHFASAGAESPTTQKQLTVFNAIVGQIRQFGHNPACLHIANSAALSNYPQTKLNLVRAGIALYGGMQPLSAVMTLRAEVVALRKLSAGERVGYGGLYETPRPSMIATLGLGYGDGLPRSARHGARVILHGIACPIVGDVSMDLCAVDVTKVAHVQIGDLALVFGRQAQHQQHSVDFADACGTISYEIMTGILPRVPRHYVHGYDD